MTTERIDELITLATLGEISDVEQRELDAAAHLDPQVRSELDDALEAAAAMQSMHAEEPPAGLRNAVLAAIAATPQEPSIESTPFVDTMPASPVPPVVSLDAERRRRRLSPKLLAAAAAVLFLVGGVVFVATNDAGTDPIAAVVDAPDASSRTLEGVISSLTVVYSRDEDAVVVTGAEVPLLDDQSTYQLWLVGDGSATSVGIFRPESDGTVSARFDGADPSDFVLGVTREPAGGSDAPTLPILAAA